MWLSAGHRAQRSELKQEIQSRVGFLSSVTVVLPAQALGLLVLCRAKLLQSFWPFAPLWTVACWAALSLGSSRQDCWSELPRLSPGDLPGIEPASLWLCELQQTGKFWKRNTRPPYLPPEKSICRSRSNSSNWTWNNRLVPNRERSTSRLYTVTLLL